MNLIYAHREGRHPHAVLRATCCVANNALLPCCEVFASTTRFMATIPTPTSCSASSMSNRLDSANDNAVGIDTTENDVWLLSASTSWSCNVIGPVETMSGRVSKVTRKLPNNCSQRVLESYPRQTRRASKLSNIFQKLLGERDSEIRSEFDSGPSGATSGASRPYLANFGQQLPLTDSFWVELGQP